MIEQITSRVQKAAGIEITPKLEIPSDDRLGHYSTSVAFQLAATTKKKPLEVAEELAKKILKEDGGELFTQVQAVAPGFINFWLTPKMFHQEIFQVLDLMDGYGSNTHGVGKKVRVEYVSANPTGPIHFGNVRGGPLGEVLCRVFERSGYEVLREYIHNDIGNQIEKFGATLWYWYEKEKGGNPEFPQGGYPGEYLHDVAKAFIEKVESVLTVEDLPQLIQFGLEFVLNDNLKTLKRVGIVFDSIVKESELAQSGKTQVAIEELKKKGVTKEQEGALWFAPGDEFLKDRESVIVRSNGQPTYFASDIAYHREKFTSGYDLVIDIFGSNHHGHVPKLQALTHIFGFNKEKFTVLLYQYVRLKKGEIAVRMAKREGNFVSAEEVLDEVGLDCMIFFLLMHSLERHIDFDMELAKERSQKNPVFYVQYAYVRARAILGKVGHDVSQKTHLDSLTNESEIHLMRKLAQFPDLISDVATHHEVHRLTTYAMELARTFHAFYEKERVIDEKGDVIEAKLALVQASKIVFENLFDLLGISKPEKM